MEHKKLIEKLDNLLESELKPTLKPTVKVRIGALIDIEFELPERPVHIEHLEDMVRERVELMNGTEYEMKTDIMDQNGDFYISYLYGDVNEQNTSILNYKNINIDPSSMESDEVLNI